MHYAAVTHVSDGPRRGVVELPEKCARVSMLSPVLQGARNNVTVYARACARPAAFLCVEQANTSRTRGSV